MLEMKGKCQAHVLYVNKFSREEHTARQQGISRCFKSHKAGVTLVMSYRVTFRSPSPCALIGCETEIHMGFLGEN